MLTLDTLNVSMLDVDNPTLTWTFESTNETITDYTLSVYRSEFPDNTADSLDSYDLVEADVSANAYSYVDQTVSGLYHHNRTWYYRLLISGVYTHETNIVPTTPAYSADDTTNRIHREILRRKRVVLERSDGRYGGVSLYLIKRRTWGTRCTDCWDETLQRVSEQNCSTCYGTGWVGGYFDPISFYGMLTTSPKFNEINTFGEWMPSDALLIMLNFPPLKAKDMVVDSVSGERWIVVGRPQETKMRGIVIEQRAQVSLLHSEDPLYAISIG